MITTLGKTYIKRYLAGLVPKMGDTIAVGIGTSAESVSSTALDLEVYRVPVTFSMYDYTTDTVVFKASIPVETAFQINEVALYSKFENASSGNYGSRNIVTFDSDTEAWYTAGVAATFTTANTRLGKDSLSHTPAASATTTSTYAGLSLDFSKNSSADTFDLAYNNGNTNVNTITIRFKTDASNYYQYVITNPAAGYTISTWTKGSMTATGTPNWASIESIDVITNSKSAGASAISYDAIRLEDVDDVDVNYVMVARKKLTTAVTKAEGQPLDIEFALSVTV